MKIEEKIFSINRQINTDDVQGVIMQIRAIASDYGELIENESSHSTSGPANRIIMSFDIIEHIDEHSIINIYFNLAGIHNGISVVDIDIEGVFRLDIKESSSFFTDSFYDFYMKKIYPSTKKSAEKRIRYIGEEIEKSLKPMAIKDL